MDVALFGGVFLAGFLMFLAPCTLPIVPAYLAFFAGIPLSALSKRAAKRSARRAVVKNALAFVVGFSLVFIALGASAGLFGVFIGPWRYALAKLAGVVFIVFGLTMLGVTPLSALARERRIKLPAFLELGRPSSSLLIGALFALGWSPCIGPILGTVLLIASASSTALYGAALLALFSAGLAVPFLLCALLVSETTALLSKFAGIIRWLTVAGAAGLILVGVLMLTGATDLVVGWGYEIFNSTGYGALLNYF